MTLATIESAITTVVERYAGLRPLKKGNPKIDLATRPYADLDMDSHHDLNIACEVEAILDIELPKDQKLLASENTALSIEQAARNIASQLKIPGV